MLRNVFSSSRRKALTEASDVFAYAISCDTLKSIKYDINGMLEERENHYG